MDETVPKGFFSDPLLESIATRLLSLEPGARLPSERQLGESLGVSRTALRDRLSSLESMGLLERRTGAGTFVVRVPPGTLGDAIALGLISSSIPLNSLQGVRHGLERQAAVEACGRVDHLNLARMAVAVDNMDAAQTTEDLREADRAFHASLFAASGDSALQFFAEVLGRALQHTKRNVSLAEDRTRMRALHRAVFDAVRDGDTQAASNAIDAHFAWLTELVDRGEDAASA